MVRLPGSGRKLGSQYCPQESRKASNQLPLVKYTVIFRGLNVTLFVNFLQNENKNVIVSFQALKMQLKLKKLKWPFQSFFPVFQLYENYSVANNDNPLNFQQILFSAEKFEIIVFHYQFKEQIRKSKKIFKKLQLFLSILGALKLVQGNIEKKNKCSANVLLHA